MLQVIYSRSGEVLTLDQILKSSGIAKRNPKRKSIAKELDRHLASGFIERTRMDDGKTWGYRLLNPSWAIAFIQGDKTKPWLSLPPKPPEVAWQIQDKHRLTYDVQLTQADFEKARQIGEFTPNPRNGGQVVVKRKEFTLSVNVRTGRGEAWLFQGWDAGILRYFSPELHQFLADQVSKKSGREHISLPVEYVNNRIKVGGMDVVLAGSHYPIELDLQGLQSDMKGKKIVQLLTDQMLFNRTIIGMEGSLGRIESGLVLLSGNLLKLAETQAKTNELLDRLINGKPKPDEQPYQPPAQDKYSNFYG